MKGFYGQLFRGLCLCAFVFVCALARPGAAAGVDETVRNLANRPTPFAVQGLSRAGSKISLLVPPPTGPTVVAVQCDGRTEIGGVPSMGGWRQTGAAVSQCIYDICYSSGYPVRTVCERKTAPFDLSFTRQNPCDASLKDPEKGHCVFDADSPAGVTGATGDDMFRIMPGAQAYFMNMNLDGAQDPAGYPYSLRWMEAAPPPAMPSPLMIPSGPSGSYADFRGFIDNPPPGMVRTEGACYPGLFDACRNPPPFDSVCGPAHGRKYTSAAVIPPGDLCAKGVPPCALPGMPCVTGAGPFLWTCNTNRGAAANCRAEREESLCSCSGCCDPLPPGTLPPTKECFFHVSGGSLAQRSGYINPVTLTQIGRVDGYSNLVGEGRYATAAPFTKAQNTTFDSMAVGSKTHIRIYRRANFAGGAFLDLKGPLVIHNGVLKGNYFNWLRSARTDIGAPIFGTYPEPFQEMFPLSKRVQTIDMPASALDPAWHQMNLWGAGTSVEVMCD